MTSAPSRQLRHRGACLVTHGETALLRFFTYQVSSAWAKKGLSCNDAYPKTHERQWRECTRKERCGGSCGSARGREEWPRVSLPRSRQHSVWMLGTLSRGCRSFAAPSHPRPSSSFPSLISSRPSLVSGAGGSQDPLPRHTGRRRPFTHACPQRGGSDVRVRCNVGISSLLALNILCLCLGL